MFACSCCANVAVLLIYIIIFVTIYLAYYINKKLKNTRMGQRKILYKPIPVLNIIIIKIKYKISSQKKDDNINESEAQQIKQTDKCTFINIKV